MQIGHLRPTKSVSLGAGSRNLYFMKPPWWFRYTLKFKNHQPRVPCISPLYCLVLPLFPYFFAWKNGFVFSPVTSLSAHCAASLISFSSRSFITHTLLISFTAFMAPDWASTGPHLASALPYLASYIISSFDNLRHWRHWLPTPLSKPWGAHVHVDTYHTHTHLL